MSRSTTTNFFRCICNAALLIVFCTRVGQAQSDISPPTSSHYTFQLLTSRGKPQSLLQLVASPDGRYLAFAGNENGITLINLQKRSIQWRVPDGTYHSLSFSPDSKTLACQGNYNRNGIYEVATGKRQPLTILHAEGTLGIKADYRGGLYQVTETAANSSASENNDLLIGNVLTAYKQHLAPTRVKEYGEWKNLVNVSGSQLVKDIAGSPGSWFRLRVRNRQSGETQDIAIQRGWPKDFVRGDCNQCGAAVMTFYRNGVFSLHSMPDGRAITYLDCQNIRQPSLTALSADGSHFAVVGGTDNITRQIVEVFDVPSSKLLYSLAYDKGECYGLAFSPDCKELLYATRDSIDPLNLSNGRWGEELLLIPAELRDPGRIAQKHVPIGFAGGLTTSYPVRVYSTNAPLTHFQVLADGRFVVVPQEGKISIWSWTERNFLEELPYAVPSRKAVSGVLLTGDERHLAIYAEGELLIYPLPQNETPEEAVRAGSQEADIDSTREPVQGD